MSACVNIKHEQLDLFQSPEPRAPQPMPAGFRYARDFIDAPEETKLIEAFAELPFKEFEFHGYLGKRRVVSFGSRYDFNSGELQEAAPMPAFLLPLRERAAVFAGLPPRRLVHALVTEYRPATSIGWHRDRPHYDDVIGISLSSPCTFRLRKKRGDGWERAAMRLDRRSVYLMRGPSRWEWEHSIPAVDDLRYSITFRSTRDPAWGG
jgi:alkylated DNA repair dioxygenase AlkB